MPKSNLIKTNLFAYHITTRTTNKEWFDIPTHRVWGLCLRALKNANAKYPVEVISFVLMSNHYHLILKTPHSDLDLFIFELNNNISLSIRRDSFINSSVFGGSYKWSLIRSTTYLHNCYRYVYQNPVRAGLTNKVENYPYSSLFYLSRQKEFIVPLFDAFGFKDAYALTWLNQSVVEEELYAIRKDLRITHVISKDSKRS